MKPGEIPPSLPHNKKLRSAILLRLPRLWHSPPRVRELAVPTISLPHTTEIETSLRAVACTNVLELLRPSVVISPSMTWDAPVHIVEPGKFVVVVLGIRYRSAKTPKDDVGSGEGLQDPEDSTHKPIGGSIFARVNASQKAQSAKEDNPYLALYGLLYPPPEEFAANLLPQYGELWQYQKTGIEFLVARDHALLADDMGLGKTAQCSVGIAVLLRSERIRRALIICPRSLVRQWVQQARKWARLNVAPVDGNWADRRRMWNWYPGVLIATPNIVKNDIDFISKNFLDLVVCDDVSMLKNPGQITTAIRSIPRERSWCLSGTPLENKPEDLTNVMEFVHPGLFSAPERLHAPSRTAIQERVRPYFLRRRKVDCLKELPAKMTFEPIPLVMNGHQASAYHHAEAQQWDELQKLGVKVTKIHIFTLINALLRICSFHKQSGESAKADEVGEQLDILFSGDGEVKVLIFTPWVETLEFLANKWSRHKPMVYHGSLSQAARNTVLDKFKTSGRLLLMSIKAGSRGLNLQEANYVFHFDRTWNPMDEMQAEDRCWRMGQQKNVFVYRFIQVATIEERIHEVLTRKHKQFLQYVDSMAEDTDPIAESQWSIEELIDLMRPAK